GRTSVEVEAKVGGGVLDAELYAKRSGWSARGSTKDFPLGMMPPGVQQAFGGLPLTGGLTAEFELSVPEDKVQEAKGFFKIVCTGCVVGDGKARVQNQPMPGQRMPMAFAEGPTVPPLSLGAATMDVKIDKGHAKLALNAQSDDGALKLDWDVELAAKLGESR